MAKWLSPLIFLLLTGCSLQSEKEPASEGYSLDVRLEGINDGALFYLIDLEKQQRIDSSRLIDGALQFTGRVAHPIPARLGTPGGESIDFWMENKPITINGVAGQLRHVEILGSPLNEAMAELLERLQPLEQRYDSLFTALTPIMHTGSPEEAALGAALNEQIGRIMGRQIAFLYEQEEQTYLTLDLLYGLRATLSQDSLKQLFARFPPELQNTARGKMIQVAIDHEKAPAIGDDYLDITGLTPAGESRRLSELEGQYLLLEFWASWCGPCRAENPNLVATYRDYQDQGFAVYGFSIDDREAAWKRALQEDQLPWLNVIGEDGSRNIYAAKYQVNAIPANYLIGPDGKIIGINLRGDALRKRLEKLLPKG